MLCRRPAVSTMSRSAYARLARSHCVKHDRRRICAFAVRDDGHARTPRPDGQLFGSRRAEGVARGQHHVFALLLEMAGQLADGGGLAHAVDAHDQDDRRALGIKAGASIISATISLRMPRTASGLPSRRRRTSSFRREMISSVVLIAHVRADQDRFQIVVEIVVQLLVYAGELIDGVGDGFACLGHALAQACKEPLLFLLLGGLRLFGLRRFVLLRRFRRFDGFGVFDLCVLLFLTVPNHCFRPPVAFAARKAVQTPCGIRPFPPSPRHRARRSAPWCPCGGSRR